MSAPPWSEVEQRLLDQVFYAHDPALVRATSDLPAAGLVDSLTTVAILEVLAVASGNDGAVVLAEPRDFTDLDSLAALYARVTH